MWLTQRAESRGEGSAAATESGGEGRIARACREDNLLRAQTEVGFGSLSGQINRSNTAVVIAPALKGQVGRQAHKSLWVLVGQIGDQTGGIDHLLRETRYRTGTRCENGGSIGRW